jgi:hypothetical protein
LAEGKQQAAIQTVKKPAARKSRWSRTAWYTFFKKLAAAWTRKNQPLLVSLINQLVWSLPIANKICSSPTRATALTATRLRTTLPILAL